MSKIKRELNDDEYRCIKCKTVWVFCPEDYEYIKEDYPDTCPFCSMPIIQVIKDIWNEGGIREIPFLLKVLWGRLIR